MSPFEGNKKGPPFSLDVTHAQSQEEKNLTFETLKSYLGLHAVSLVPVPRVSLHPSGPVFEGR